MRFLEALFGDSALRDEVASIKRELREIRLEWDDFYDKAAKILRRIGRDRAKLEALPEEPEGQPPQAILPPDGGSPHGGLTPRQREIQQKILRRRAGLQ